jgi:hypothetical protein
MQNLIQNSFHVLPINIFSIFPLFSFLAEMVSVNSTGKIFSFSVYFLLLFALVIRIKEKFVLLSFRILSSLKEIFLNVIDALI